MEKKVGRRAGTSSLFCGRCPRYFGCPTDHVRKNVRGQGKCIQVTKTGVVLPLILLVLLSHEQLSRAEENAAEVFRKRRYIYSGTEHEREVNSCWIRSGAFLVAVRCQRAVRGSGKIRHFARAYQGVCVCVCVRVCTLLGGVPVQHGSNVANNPEWYPDKSAKDKSANDTSAKPTVRMPTVRKGQQCE